MKIPTSPLALVSNLWTSFGHNSPTTTPYAPEPGVENLASCNSLKIQSRLSTSSYDYLVIGAGAGGGPVAASLAVEGWNVLVIEAGKDYVTFNTTIPLYLIQATEDPEISLNYYAHHYPKGAEYDDVQTWYPRAQGLGGCTIHNALINLIPHKWDFNQLSEMFGDESWQWENMAPYFTKIENNLWMEQGLGRPIGHGYGGWMSTTLPPVNLLTDFPDPQLNDVIGSIIQGRPQVLNQDFNDWRNDAAEGGAWINYTKQSNGTRSTVRDRLSDVHGAYPQRLKFAFESWATRILTCKTTEGGVRAYGVEAYQGVGLNPVSSKHKGKGKNISRIKRWYAKREVILSAGPFESPRLLMLSGIGDRDQLNKHGIPPLVHSPGVGENLQDRVEETTVFNLKQPHVVFKNCTFGYDTLTDPCLAQWFDDGHKNLYAAGAALYAWSYKSLPSLPYRDVFSFWGPAAFFGYYPGWVAETLESTGSIVHVMLKAHTASRGWVRLTGSDPQDKLEINKNEFVTEAGFKDLKAVADGMMAARKFVNETALFNQHVAEVIWPSPDVQTEKDYEKFVRKNQWGHHACCTNKMGNDSDPMAVLNGNFQVRGVENLRVVDLSIWPTIPGMFVTTPMYMVSEKAADVINAYAV